MTNEYYGAASTPNEDFLAHYGIKGMKWGVRKARESGNARRLGRQFNKAQKKLAKLEKRAASGKKYAKRAALLGAGAAAAGGLAAGGTAGVAKLMDKGSRGAGTAMLGAGRLMARSGIPGVKNAGAYMMGAGRRISRGNAVSRASGAVEGWGKQSSLYNLATGNKKAVSKAMQAKNLGGMKALASANSIPRKAPLIGAKNIKSPVGKSISNDTIARIGAAGVGAGLLGAAGYNAYRAATTKRAAKKAAQFRSEMNKAFAGTKYANQVASSGYRPKQKKRRRG